MEPASSPKEPASSPKEPASSPRHLAFPRALRLRTRADFNRARTDGKTFHSRHLRVNVRPDPALAAPRLGVITSRKLGGAVARNRLRRLVREAFRLNRGAWSANADVVVVPKPGAPDAGRKALREELLLLWKKAGLM